METVHLALDVEEPFVVQYLAKFEEEERAFKALEALKVGVLALQSGSPTLDTQIVAEQFGEFMAGLKEQWLEIPKDIAEQLDKQIGPASKWAQKLDPKNKDSVISAIEKTVQTLVESRMEKIQRQLSLDDEESAMSRLKKMFAESMGEIQRALGAKDGRKEEKERGHIKGIDFQSDLYRCFADWAAQLGDESENVTDSCGLLNRCKCGDYVLTLGESAGAPGERIVVEAKDKRMSLKDAREELQKAKENRGASYAIFVFSEGSAPAELVNGFLRLGDDLFCVVNKEDLEQGIPLRLVEIAYRILRGIAVTAARKETAGAIDQTRVQAHVEHLVQKALELAEWLTKARTIKNNGEFLERQIPIFQNDLDERLRDMLQMLRGLNEAA